MKSSPQLEIFTSFSYSIAFLDWKPSSRAHSSAVHRSLHGTFFGCYHTKCPVMISCKHTLEPYIFRHSRSNIDSSPLGLFPWRSFLAFSFTLLLRACTQQPERLQELTDHTCICTEQYWDLLSRLAVPIQNKHSILKHSISTLSPHMRMLHISRPASRQAYILLEAQLAWYWLMPLHRACAFGVMYRNFPYASGKLRSCCCEGFVGNAKRNRDSHP